MPVGDSPRFAASTRTHLTTSLIPEPFSKSSLTQSKYAARLQLSSIRPTSTKNVSSTIPVSNSGKSPATARTVGKSDRVTSMPTAVNFRATARADCVLQTTLSRSNKSRGKDLRDVTPFSKSLRAPVSTSSLSKSTISASRVSVKTTDSSTPTGTPDAKRALRPLSQGRAPDAFQKSIKPRDSDMNPSPVEDMMPNKQMESRRPTRVIRPAGLHRPPPPSRAPSLSTLRVQPRSIPPSRAIESKLVHNSPAAKKLVSSAATSPFFPTMSNLSSASAHQTLQSQVHLLHLTLLHAPCSQVDRKLNNNLPAHLARRQSLLSFRSASLVLLERQVDQHLALEALLTWSDGNMATCARWIGVLINVLKELGELTGGIVLDRPTPVSVQYPEGDLEDSWASDPDATVVEDASLLDKSSLITDSSHLNASHQTTNAKTKTPIYPQLLEEFANYVATVRGIWTARDTASSPINDSCPTSHEFSAEAKIAIRVVADTLDRLSTRLVALPSAPLPRAAPSAPRTPARSATALASRTNFSPSKSMGAASQLRHAHSMPKATQHTFSPSRSVMERSTPRSHPVNRTDERAELKDAIPLQILAFTRELVQGMLDEVQAMRELEWEVKAGEAAWRMS